MKRSLNLKKFLWPVVVAVGTMQSSIHAMPLPKINTKQKQKSPFLTKRDCKALIRQMEIEYKIPEGLLMALACIESEYNPWAVNCNGASKGFHSYEAAKNFVQELRAQGCIDINIGILQINYGYHKTRFKKAEDALNPYHNITYAAKYLAYLKKFHGGSWEKAVRFYHSPVEKYQNMYLHKVNKFLKKNYPSTFQSFNNPVTIRPVRATAMKETNLSING